MSETPLYFHCNCYQIELQEYLASSWGFDRISKYRISKLLCKCFKRIWRLYWCT